MFNVFLTKMVENDSGCRPDDRPKTLEETMWDVVIFTIAGCPGALVRIYRTLYTVCIAYLNFIRLEHTWWNHPSADDGLLL